MVKGYREVWIEANGPIPKGMHIHHILPRYLGGTDDLDNLQLVTPEEHYDIHFERGEYGACALLSDGIDREAPMRAVVRFDLDGYRVGSFESTIEAARDLNLPHLTPQQHAGAITDCSKYRAKSYRGYQWFYESEVGDVDYVGPVKRKSNNGGVNTSKCTLFDLVKMEPIQSKREGARRLGITTPPGNSTFKSEEFVNRFIPISKDEYKFFKQLEL